MLRRGAQHFCLEARWATGARLMSGGARPRSVQEAPTEQLGVKRCALMPGSTQTQRQWLSACCRGAGSPEASWVWWARTVGPLQV